MSSETLTVKLRNGAIVLAKNTKHGVFARTYANLTQAEKAATQFGGYVIHPMFGRVFYVCMEQPS